MKISVIIPVRNGAQTLNLCLSSLSKQTVKDQMEIIVLDSMSIDGSREIALSYGAHIVDIPNGTFDHGLTRNKGVQAATGDLIYLTVQDAWISDTGMLEKMAKHFQDVTVKAVVGHQAVPHEKDKNPFIWYRPISAPSVTEKLIAGVEAFKKLTVKEQQSLIAWDDVVAMYRKDALLQQPFVQTAFAEDWIWSFNALQKEWKLLHDSSLVVYHYHHHSFQYAFKSSYTINYHFYKFFKYKPTIPALIKPIAQIIYHLLRNKILSKKEKLYWILHNVSGRLSVYIATINFLVRFKMLGERGVERGYYKYCNSIPQGQLKK